MGKIKLNESLLTFTKLQKSIFNALSKNPELTKKFYLTGGTALSAVYLHHRESEDLDCPCR
jgi:predicted nucleotidyltransferase component of viral defense system